MIFIVQRYVDYKYPCIVLNCNQFSNISFRFFSIASTISSQLLMAQVFLCVLDFNMARIWVAWHPFYALGLLFWAVKFAIFIPIPAVIRNLVISRKLRRTNLLTKTGASLLSFLLPFQALDLPASKVRYGKRVSQKDKNVFNYCYSKNRWFWLHP